MDQAHLHLVITHLPIFGSILGAFVLGYGIWCKSMRTKMAAYYLFIISALGTGIAFLTGEGAEEAVENIQGISENIIGQHEEFAMFALISLIILGLSSLIALFVTYRSTALSNIASVSILFISIISFALVARTGYLGGQIRHSEITAGAASQENGETDDD